MDLSIILLDAIDREKTSLLVRDLHQLMETNLNGIRYEIVLVTGNSDLNKKPIQLSSVDRLVPTNLKDYGEILKIALASSRGNFLITLDSHFGQDPNILNQLWADRENADVLIASRCLPGGSEIMATKRYRTIGLLNLAYRIALSLPIQDMSSGIRLYRREVFDSIVLKGSSIDILPEIVIRAYASGFKISEIPYEYQSIRYNPSPSIQFNLGLLGNLQHMWQLRNSIDSADYDERAFESKIPPQRYWQRKRYHIITRMVPPNAKVLDIGCGSSRILHDLPNAVGLDIRLNKLRYMRRYDKDLVNGTIFTLPYKSEIFDCVICSEVIEHIPMDHRIFSEIKRVLRPGGTLIIGTPDYASPVWVIIEAVYKHVLPNGYADEHITHYTKKSLQELLQEYGFSHKETASILGAEIILRLEKQ